MSLSANKNKTKNKPLPDDGARVNSKHGPITISLEELQRVKLFVGIPMYGGMCSGITTRSIMELSMFCATHNIKFVTHFLFNESLIQRARNYIADEFLRSDCTHMLFIDADIGFKYDDVVTLILHSLRHEDCDGVVAGVYARKSIAWEKVYQAATSGKVTNPNHLEKYSGDFVFNYLEGTTSFSVNQPLQVSETGTGFMLIPRNVFEKFKEAYPETKYTPDHVRSVSFDGSRDIHAFFHCEIDPQSGRYLSEDYYFCRKLLAIGVKTTVLPWVKLIHAGAYMYQGSISDMADLQMDLVSAGHKDGNEGSLK